MDLTEEEKHAAAMACRAYAFKAGEDADSQTNPTVKAKFIATQSQFEELAKKFDRAKRNNPPSNSR